MAKPLKSSFQSRSYQSHEQQYALELQRAGADELHKNWFRSDTVDAWRHLRAFKYCRPFCNDPLATWVTIGDGRYGLDAIRLMQVGAHKVLPTDISPVLLSKAVEKKLIDSYSVENAEALNFNDAQFDYAFCKESYHHFPRPMLALYEMLRVTKRGVILVEPEDLWHSRIHRAKHSLLTILGRKRHYDSAQYEESGNFVFSISRREIEKIALGLNYPFIAFRGFNDNHQPGMENQRLSWGNLTYLKLRLRIFVQDILSLLGLKSHSMLIAVIFKSVPSLSLIQELKSLGWNVMTLPRNPYLKDLSD